MKEVDLNSSIYCVCCCTSIVGDISTLSLGGIGVTTWFHAGASNINTNPATTLSSTSCVRGSYTQI